MPGYIIIFDTEFADFTSATFIAWTWTVSFSAMMRDQNVQESSNSMAVSWKYFQSIGMHASGRI